ncbi:MAG: hypothetical protein WBB01_16885 [Phormidesmis sp.]
MAKKFKVTELFLSLGLIASLATACGGPTEDSDVIEGDNEVIEEPMEEGEMGEGEMEEGEMEEEGGEGGEG